MFKKKKLRAKKRVEYRDRTEVFYRYDGIPCIHVKYKDLNILMTRRDCFDQDTLKGILTELGFVKSKPVHVSHDRQQDQEITGYSQDI